MIREIIYGVGIIFMIAIALPIVYTVMVGFNDAFQSIPELSSEAKTISQEQTTLFSQTWDYVFLTVFISMVIGLLALSYFLKTQPALFWVAFLVVIFCGLAAGVFANSWVDIEAQSSSWAATIASFPIMSFMISNYLTLILSMAGLMLVMFYGKPGEAI